MTPSETGEVVDKSATLPRLRHIMGTDWRQQARCSSLPKSYFFDYNKQIYPLPERRERIRNAKNVCRGCAVRDKCYEFAVLNNEQHGIWAGTLPEERKTVVDSFRKTGILEILPIV